MMTIELIFFCLSVFLCVCLCLCLSVSLSLSLSLSLRIFDYIVLPNSQTLPSSRTNWLQRWYGPPISPSNSLFLQHHHFFSSSHSTPPPRFLFLWFHSLLSERLCQFDMHLQCERDPQIRSSSLLRRHHCHRQGLICLPKTFWGQWGWRFPPWPTQLARRWSGRTWLRKGRRKAIWVISEVKENNKNIEKWLYD